MSGSLVCRLCRYLSHHHAPVLETRLLLSAPFGAWAKQVRKRRESEREKEREGERERERVREREEREREPEYEFWGSVSVHSFFLERSLSMPYVLLLVSGLPPDQE